MSQFKKLIGSIKRKPTAAIDGKTDAEAAGFSDEMAPTTTVLYDLFHHGKDSLSLAHALKDLSKGEPLDDRKLLLENGVSMLQRLPENSGLSHLISDSFIGMLWKDLSHPPSSYCGPDFRYHSADGSGNNPLNPTLGAAGQPYSRSVPPITPKSPFLPDPELVFDQLLRRRSFEPHKSGLNRMFFSFATVVIHECFQSDYEKPWINATSSYVDLSTLYGNNQNEQDKVRTFEQGRIYPDTIASERIMMMPPPVVACLLLFSRHHNHIAERLYAINECGKYQPWETLNADQRKRQDNDIFQLSRNINVAFFAQVVLTDYVSAILNTVRADSKWHLDLGKEIKNLDGSRLERGTGNSVSCEFNILYHWHASLSAADEKWMEGLIKDANPDADINLVGVPEFRKMAEKHKSALKNLPPSEWTFNGFKRDSRGYFENRDLGELIKDAIQEPAHAFGARGTPSCMKVIDILGQLRARNVFNVCTMNEFRKYLNLAPFKSFEEWNPDPEIAHAAEILYGHVDQLELYPGLLAEEAKPNMPGSGVQPGHTIGRGILDDAVALVRGDRFLTHDLNANTLTNWGMAQLKPVEADGAYGGYLNRLLFNALPNSWGKGYSSYCLLPFYTPTAVCQILKDNKKLEKYDTQRHPEAKLYGLHSWHACKEAFQDRDTYRVFYLPNLNFLTENAGFFLGYDDAHRHDPPKQIMLDAFFEPGFEKHVINYYGTLTKEKISSTSLSFNGPTPRKQLNVVRDVFNVVPIFWIAQKYGIPLKTKQTPHGLLSPYQLHLTLVGLFIYSSFDLISRAGWELRDAAEKLGPVLRKLFKYRLDTTSGAEEAITDTMTKGTDFSLSKEAHFMYHKIHEKKMPTNKAIGALIGTMLPIAGNITQQSALLLDLFLEPEYKYAKDRMIELAFQNTKEAEKEMEMWVWEGMRIRGIVPGLPRMAARDLVVEDGPNRTLEIKEGEHLIIATSKAHLDPTVFPNPTLLDPTRPKKSYILLGFGMHFCFGARLVGPSIVAMLKEVLKLKNLRRAKGLAGKMIKVHNNLGHDGDAVSIQMYLDQNCKESPIPTSLVVEYDE